MVSVLAVDEICSDGLQANKGKGGSRVRVFLGGNVEKGEAAVNSCRAGKGGFSLTCSLGGVGCLRGSAINCSGAAGGSGGVMPGSQISR